MHQFGTLSNTAVSSHTILKSDRGLTVKRLNHDRDIGQEQLFYVASAVDYSFLR